MIKSIILGILLWGLVPTVWMTNKVNETYAKSYDMDFTLEDTEKLLDKDNDSASVNSNKTNDIENNNTPSYHRLYQQLKRQGK